MLFLRHTYIMTDGIQYQKLFQQIEHFLNIDLVF